MERWITAHQIGLLAYMWDAIDERDDSVAMKIISALQRRVYAKSATNGKEIWRVLEGLPPSALTLLKRVTDCHDFKTDALFAARREMNKCHWWLTDPDALEIYQSSRLARATMWADHALLARTSAPRMLRLGQALFGQTWKTIESDGISELAGSLEVLRDPWKASWQRAEAVGRISQLLQEVNNWNRTQIENRLYDRLFFWPLLVPEKDSEESDNGKNHDVHLGFSLPVAVDVHPPTSDGSSDREDRDEAPIVGGEDILDIEAWREPLRRSVRAGKTLWRSKHGNYGDFRREITSRQTSVVFDFSHASRIMRPYQEARIEGLKEDGIEPESDSFSLSNRSAEAYFAQAVLNDLLGHPNIQANAATGMIGDPIGLNYELEAPDGIHAKLRYAFASQRFEQVVLPEGARSKWKKYVDSQDTVKQTAPVKCVSSLALMTDVMQMPGWRQYHYIRCPDIEWGIHSEGQPGYISKGFDEWSKVESMLGLLEKNESQVRALDATPEVVASALWHINDTKKKEEFGPKNAPPHLSWAFIRVREDDEDLPFWHLVWDTLGTPGSDFEEFLLSVDAAEATEHLSDALNTFEPNFRKPNHRAPDVLVIIGSEHLEDSYNEATRPSARPFGVPPILDRLRESLTESPNDKITHLIGKTRILLISQHEKEPDAVSSDLKQYRDPAHPFRKLATFRGGFTQHMADLALNGEYERDRLRMQVLEPGVRKGQLRKFGGTYHLSESVRQFLAPGAGEDEALSLEEQARLHYRAGCASAPYVKALKLPSIAADIAFSPEHVHEAQYHFRQAHKLAEEDIRQQDKKTLHTDIREAVVDMLCYHSLPRWETVERLLSFVGNEPSGAYEEATRLVRLRKETSSRTVHPKHRVLAAHAAHAYAKSLRGENPSKSSALHEEARGHFEVALQRIPDFPDAEEYPNSVLVLSHYVEFLKESSPEKAFEVAQKLRRTVEERSPEQNYTYIPGGRPSALDFAGDYVENHETAFSFYRAGMLINSRWWQSWAKGLGAAALAGASKPNQTVLSEIGASDADAQELHEFLKGQLWYMEKTRDNPSTPRHVRDRLARGIEQIEALD